MIHSLEKLKTVGIHPGDVKTRTYEPLTYPDLWSIIENLYEVRRDWIIQPFEKHRIIATDDGNIINGEFQIATGSKYAMVIMYENSYNKLVKPRIGVGAWIPGVKSGVTIISKAFDSPRSKIGIREQFQEYVIESIKDYKSTMKTIETKINRSREILISEDVCAKLSGVMFWNDYITGQQLKILKSDLLERFKLKRKIFLFNFIFDLYQVMKISHPRFRLDNYVRSWGVIADLIKKT